ncbi:hypothetical protein EV421DRAFT_1909269 [Armillaria borealis]|uniref:Uncharacterized protein n=1 Tax=Armillaria borealis TaxID=47425 RepID=A0AA39J1W8_9AGAR|nr:hypothetical protein EV421DRAFT_1909269 [Armillaria borealis]
MLAIEPLGRSSLRAIRNLVANVDTFFPSAAFVEIPIVETRTVVTEVEVKPYEDPEDALSPPMDRALGRLPSSPIDLSSTCESACSSPGSRIISPSGRPPFAVTNSIRVSRLAQEHRRGPPPLPPRRSPHRIAASPVLPVVTKPAKIVRGQGHPMGTPPPLLPRPSPRGVATPPPPAVVNSVRVSKIVQGSPPPLPPRRSSHGIVAMIPPPLAVINPTRVPTIVLGQGHPMGPLPSPRQLSSSPLGLAPRYPPRSRCKGDRSL